MVVQQWNPKMNSGRKSQRMKAHQKAKEEMGKWSKVECHQIAQYQKQACSSKA